MNFYDVIEATDIERAERVRDRIARDVRRQILDLESVRELIEEATESFADKIGLEYPGDESDVGHDGNAAAEKSYLESLSALEDALIGRIFKPEPKTRRRSRK